MLFNSMVFLWVFLPVVIIVNFILSILKFKDESQRIRLKNLFLLLSSFVFYAWGGIYYLLIMIGTIVIDYAGGRFIDNNKDDIKKKKTGLIVTITLNLSILFFFKYFNMVVIIIDNILSLGAKGVQCGEILKSLLRDTALDPTLNDREKALSYAKKKIEKSK